MCDLPKGASPGRSLWRGAPFGWVEAELDEWLRERIAESRGAVGE